jgi:predicted AAA+ superfamily ATPase
MMELFREFIVVGGMPQVVQEFCQSGNFVNVLRVQRDILAGYNNDIAKYAEGTEKEKARACFASVPRQLAKDYKKFQYSLVEKKATGRKFAGSLQWLYDAGIINFCYNLSTPALPLEGNVKNDEFKVYMRDTGLLVAMLEDGTQRDIIEGNLGVYKGAIYENIIADLLAKSGRKLYYFEYRSQIEVDFIIRREGRVCALEVKAAENTKSKSLVNIIKNYGVRQGVRLSGKNYRPNAGDAISDLPLYMAMWL